MIINECHREINLQQKVLISQWVLWESCCIWRLKSDLKRLSATGEVKPQAILKALWHTVALSKPQVINKQYIYSFKREVNSVGNKRL